MGSNPMFPIIIVYGNIYHLIKLMNMANSNNVFCFNIKYTTKLIKFIILFYKLGILSFYVHQKKNIQYFKIIFNLSNFAYSFSKINIISTQGKQYYISYKSLNLLSQRLGITTLILNTHYGLITHQKALQLKSGGSVFCLIT